MDSFLTSVSGPDSLSLQEMLDMDIKSEKDIDEIFGFDLHELPSINLDEDSLGAPGENNVWLASSSDGNSLLGGDISNGLSSDMTAGETRMVCPNSVMPVTLIQVPYDKPSPRAALSAKATTTERLLKNQFVGPSSPVPGADAGTVDVFSGRMYIKEDPNSSAEEDEDQVDSFTSPPRSFKNFAMKKTKMNELPVKTPTISGGIKRNGPAKPAVKRRDDLFLTPSAYPKPGYSYSCLIAMALKNSPSGSLPVSEIYNFMCQHFPYFKTAPTGWKNSVRHNLSLNKCFEKIEKPATNGSQRKGCLWAMNPNKVNKMDEEVQKWSKKDKTAIRKSMIYPENLDALERGQLFVSGGYNQEADVDSDDDHWERNVKTELAEDEEDEQEESEEEEEEEEEEVEEDVDDLRWMTGEKRLSRLTADDILSGFPVHGEDYDSDLSLTDFDIEVAESIYNPEKSAGKNKVNVKVKVSTSPNGFQPLMSGAYTVNSNTSSASSPKRLKTLAGSTITGNYVYKPLSSTGSTSVRRKSPIRHPLLSSLEADD